MFEKFCTIKLYSHKLQKFTTLNEKLQKLQNIPLEKTDGFSPAPMWMAHIKNKNLQTWH